MKIAWIYASYSFNKPLFLLWTSLSQMPERRKRVIFHVIHKLKRAFNEISTFFAFSYIFCYSESEQIIKLLKKYFVTYNFPPYFILKLAIDFPVFQKTYFFACPEVSNLYYFFGMIMVKRSFSKRPFFFVLIAFNYL